MPVLVCNPAHGVGSEHVIAYFHDLVLVHHEDGGAGAKRRMAAARRHLPHFGIAAECGMGRMHPDLVVPLLQAHADALA